jgi:hypothetical protein
MLAEAIDDRASDATSRRCATVSGAPARRLLHEVMKPPKNLQMAIVAHQGAR